MDIPELIAKIAKEENVPEANINNVIAMVSTHLATIKNISEDVIRTTIKDLYSGFC